jgi:hypothetical protein
VAVAAAAAAAAVYNFLKHVFNDAVKHWCYTLLLVDAWMSMEDWRNDTERAEPEHFKKNPSSGHFVHSEPASMWWESSD